MQFWGNGYVSKIWSKLTGQAPGCGYTAVLLLTPGSFCRVDGRGNVGALSWLWQPGTVPFYKAQLIHRKRREREENKPTKKQIPYLRFVCPEVEEKIDDELHEAFL